MKLAVAIIAPWVFFYLAGSFIGMHFNPMEWDTAGRISYVFLSTGASSLTFASVYPQD